MCGPAGTGKSRAIIERLHAIAEKYPGCRLAMIRKTRASLTTTGIITYQKIVLPPGAAEVNYQQASYPNGSVIVFAGMDKASKIMSSEYDVIYVQEATELTEADWESLTTRLRWGHVPYQMMIADCNPGAPGHWINRRAKDGRCVMLDSRHEENPRLWARYDPGNPDHGPTPWEGYGWTPDGQAYLGKLDALTGARYLRLRKGIWAASEGMVYDGYDPKIHLVDRFDVPREWRRIWSIDFGLTNPFVWQVWAQDPDGRLYRTLEIYRTQRLVEQHAQDILRIGVANKEPWPIAIICDHDAEGRATLERHLNRGTGIAYKAIRAGIQAVQSRLKPAVDGKPRLFFMRDALAERDDALYDAKLPTCTEEEIESYIWPPGRGDRAEVPVDRDNHGMDAMRYCVAYADSLAYDPSRRTEIRVDRGRVHISPI